MNLTPDDLPMIWAVFLSIVYVIVGIIVSGFVFTLGDPSNEDKPTSLLAVQCFIFGVLWLPIMFYVIVGAIDDYWGG